MGNAQKYFFYHKDIPNMLMVKVTNNDIEYRSYYNGEQIKVSMHEIQSIVHEAYTVRTSVFNRLAIKSNSKFLKHRIDLNDLNNVKELFEVLNTMYSKYAPKKLEYERYQFYNKQNKLLSSFGIFAGITLVVLMALPFFYILIMTSLSKPRYAYAKLFAEEKAKSIAVSSSKNFFCPRIFRAIKNTEQEGVYKYKEQCIYKKFIVTLDESVLSADEAQIMINSAKFQYSDF